MSDETTTATTWLSSATVGVQIQYAIACAIGDRRTSAEFWAEHGNPTLEADARESALCFEKLRDDIINGRVTVVVVSNA